VGSGRVWNIQRERATSRTSRYYGPWNYTREKEDRKREAPPGPLEIGPAGHRRISPPLTAIIIKSCSGGRYTPEWGCLACPAVGAGDRYDVEKKYLEDPANP